MKERRYWMDRFFDWRHVSLGEYRRVQIPGEVMRRVSNSVARGVTHPPRLAGRVMVARLQPCAEKLSGIRSRTPWQNLLLRLTLWLLAAPKPEPEAIEELARRRPTFPSAAFELSDLRREKQRDFSEASRSQSGEPSTLPSHVSGEKFQARCQRAESNRQKAPELPPNISQSVSDHSPSYCSACGSRLSASTRQQSEE